MTSPEDQRVRAAVRRHLRNSAFAEADKAITLVLSDPQVQQARAQIEAAETQIGMQLRARLQPFQDRYEQAVRDGDADVLIKICPGRHGRWGRICVLDEGHETSRVGGQRPRRLVSATPTAPGRPGPRRAALDQEQAAAFQPASREPQEVEERAQVPGMGGRLRKENTDLRRTLAVYEEAIRQLALENDALRGGAAVVPLPTRTMPASS